MTFIFLLLTKLLFFLIIISLFSIMLVITKFLNKFKFTLYYFILSLILSSLTLFYFKYELLYTIIKPSLLKDFQFSEIILTNLFEAIQYYLLIILMIATIANLFLLIFLIFNYSIQFLNFISIKFYKKTILKFTLFFIVLNYLFIFLILPNILNYFLTFQNIQHNYPLTLKLQLKLSDYTTLYIKMFLYFNMFLFLFVLLQKTKNWIQLKKYIYFSTILLISFITPPDVTSFIFLIFPILAIFEILHIYTNIKNYYKN